MILEPILTPNAKLTVPATDEYCSWPLQLRVTMRRYDPVARLHCSNRIRFSRSCKVYSALASNSPSYSERSLRVGKDAVCLVYLSEAGG